MLEKFRTQVLNWDLANKKIVEDFNANSGDTNGRKLQVNITDGYQPVDLTYANVSLGWTCTTGHGLDAFTPINAAAGQYAIEYTTEMLSNVGQLTASLILTTDRMRIESRSFRILVEQSSVDDEAVQSENSFTALTEALVKVSQMQEDFDGLYSEKEKMMDDLATDKGKAMDDLHTEKETKLDKLHTDEKAEFDGLYADKSQMMDTLHDDKKADMETLEADYSNRANTLETTYAPRLTGVEGEIDEVSAQLAQYADLPSETVKKNVTISEQFPTKSLSEVRQLNPDATLNDTADWFVLQSFIDKTADNRNKDIKIPEGRYYLSQTLDLSRLEYGTFIDMKGVILEVVDYVDDVIKLEHRGNHWKARRTTITGVEIRGEYFAKKGISQYGVQEVYLDTVRVHGCRDGLYYADVWYGEVSGESVIQDCLHGIEFGRLTTSEINTIDFRNVKINIGGNVDKNHFTPLLEPNEENISYGWNLGVVMGGVGFDGVTVEGTDHVFYYKPIALNGSGNMVGLISITNGYFEAIKKSFFNMSESATPNHIQVSYNLTLNSCRFLGRPPEISTLSEGSYVFRQNQRFRVEFIHGIIRSRIRVIKDENPEIVNLDTDINDPQLQIKSEVIPRLINADRFQRWGSNDVFPTTITSIPNYVNDNFVTLPSFVRPNSHPISKVFDAKSLMTKPITFLNTEDNKMNGPVLHAPNGEYFMILVDNEGNLTSKKVNNRYVIDESINTKTAKELWLSTSKYEIGQIFRVKEFGYDLTLGLYNGKRYWCRDGIPYISTTLGILELLTETVNGRCMYNVNTNQVWMNRNQSYFEYIDPLGNQTVQRVAGTFDQRPSNPEIGLVYYDTESTEYSRWDGIEYKPFEPNVVPSG